MNFVQEHLKISEIVQEKFKTAAYLLNIRHKTDKKPHLNFDSLFRFCNFNLKNAQIS